MNLRADHVAGAVFVLFGALVIALSGDLPTGRLSMPGSGFLPKILASLTIVLGLALILQPTPVHALEELGKHNEVMPQKSTYFYPKLATGLLINPLG